MDPRLNVKHGIFALKCLNDGNIALMDQRSTLRIVEPKSLKVIDGFKSGLVHEHRILNIVDISYGGKYTLIGIPNKNKAALFLNKEKKLKATIGAHNGDIESVAISDDEHYVATGGVDGRTFVYHAATLVPFIALTPHSDYITCIKFSDDSHTLAFGSFDRTITVKNIAMMSEEFVLKGHAAPIKKILFLSLQLLVAADRDGGLVVWDLHKRAVKVRMTKMLEEILDMTLSKDKRFLFVSTIYGNIGLYDLETFTCISPSYIKSKGRVNALAVSDEEQLLLYGTQEGELFSHSLLEGEEILTAAIEEGNFKRAYRYVEKNILLRFSPHYKSLESSWEKALSQAKQLYGKGLAETAIQVLTPFADVDCKRSMVKTTIQEFESFSKFTHYIKERKYALAYSMAASHPVYKETAEYQELESIWERQFLKAKKAILAKTGEEQAREHLALFRGVSHKAKLISALYNQRKVYMLFRSKLAQKDFKAIFNLAMIYPFLVMFKEYVDLISWGNAIYLKIQRAYAKHDYLSAVKYAEHIKDFPDFKDEISSLIDNSQVYINFKQAMDGQDLDKIYKLLEKNSYLADLPAMEEIDPQWERIVNEVEEPISQGDIGKLQDLLQEYPYRKYKTESIMLFIKSSYLRQIEIAIARKEPKAKIVEGFKNFYAIFGRDDLLMIKVERYQIIQNTTIDFSHIKAKEKKIADIIDAKLSIFES